MESCPGSLMHSLEKLRLEEKYTDVSVLVEGRTSKCHCNVLAAASAYFDCMLGGNFKESRVEELHLHDIDPELFEKVLQNIYGGELIINKVNAFDLLRISEFLSVQTIRDSSMKFILNNIYLFENVIEMFLWVRALNILPLIEPLLKFISYNFIRLSGITKFLEMPFDDLRVVLTSKYHGK